MVSILVFIYKDICEPAPVKGQRFRACGKQLNSTHNKIIEVNSISSGHPILVFRIYGSKNAVCIAQVAYRVCGQAGMEIRRMFVKLFPPACQGIFPVGDCAEDHPWRVPFGIDIEILTDDLDKPLAVSCIINRKPAFKANLVAVPAQDADARRMEC